MEVNEEEMVVSVEELLRLHDEEKEKENLNRLFSDIEEVEEIIGYEFRDQRLLRQAFTHGSCLAIWSTPSYERLEYFGDSVLNFLIARDGFLSYPDLPPGKLTRLRAANVDTEKLARAAVKHNLHKYIRHRTRLFGSQIEEFMDAIMEYPLHSNGLIDPPKFLADIVESTIGAVFIDSNSSTDATWKVIKKLLEPIITPTTLGTHPVTRLYEICQKHGLEVRFVDAWKEAGAIEVFVDNELIDRGIYSPKKLIALNRAANNAYNELVRKLGEGCNDDDNS